MTTIQPQKKPTKNEPLVHSQCTSGALVVEWQPEHAVKLQRALKMTNEKFAERLGISTRTVAKWRSRETASISLEIQEALATLLRMTTSEEQGLFYASLETHISLSQSVESACKWLDSWCGDEQGSAARTVARRLLKASKTIATTRLDRVQMLRNYYTDRFQDSGFINVRVNGEKFETSLATRKAWFSKRDLITNNGFRLETKTPDQKSFPTELHGSAIEYLVSAQYADARLTNGRLYSIQASERPWESTFSLTSFFDYALTYDMLELELAMLERTTKARDILLPDWSTLLNTTSRNCVGGVLALTALARPSRRQRPADYALLVQHRGEHVVNGRGSVSVIPKCFHQPINDVYDEANILESLMREVEEELLGRHEVDHTIDGLSRRLAPMHPSQVSPAMKNLTSHAKVTGLGLAINAVNGNYEYPALLSVHDEQFWNDYGGEIVTNWETSSIESISSLDSDQIMQLVTTKNWSDEGLVAFILGIAELHSIDPERVADLEISWEVE